MYKRQGLAKASRRDSASLVKGGGPRQGKREGFASLVKGGGPRQGKPEGFFRVIWNLNRLGGIIDVYKRQLKNRYVDIPSLPKPRISTFLFLNIEAAL